MFRNVSRYDWFAVLWLVALIGVGYALQHSWPPFNAISRTGDGPGTNMPYEYARLLRGSRWIGIAFQWVAAAGIGLVLLGMMFPRGIGRNWHQNEYSGHQHRITAREYGHIEYNTAAEGTEFLSWWQSHRDARGAATVAPVIWLFVVGMYILSNRYQYEYHWVGYAYLFFGVAYYCGPLLLLQWPFGLIWYAWSLHKRSAVPRYKEPPPAPSPTKQQPHGPVSDEGTI